jgi:hypothetical protein
MDMRPILLPRHEMQTRKVRELRTRGYSITDIAATMGLRRNEVEDLLPTAERKNAAKAAAKGRAKP